MSIGYHMLNTSTTLFSGAVSFLNEPLGGGLQADGLLQILESGTTTSVPALAPALYESNYQALVATAGCSAAANPFVCLQTVDMNTLINATNVLYGQPTLFGSRPWGVTIDGNIIPASPSVLTAQGAMYVLDHSIVAALTFFPFSASAKIPFIVGDVMDEGTIFVKPNTIATDADLLAFLQTDYANRNASFFTNATSISTLTSLYPNDPTQGSPFGTGNVTFFGAEFKRGAAIYGDIHFHWPRRNFLNIAAANHVNAWSFIFDQFTPTSAAWQGVFHTGEIPYIFQKFGPADGTLYTLAQTTLSYWLSFAYNRNPNVSSNGPTWTPYSNKQNNIVFTANLTSMQPDNFRIQGTK
ncbi:hypothetical protein C0991_000989 [Blastosporella zonata]|nr:hypothetical protein C0991_000989 [Blastosporella zonata]